MDALALIMISAVVIGVGFFFHRLQKASQNPTDLPPGAMTVDQFYAQNPLRSDSPEADLGDGWRDPNEPHCTFSVFWLEDTVEVYALRVPNPVQGVHDGVGDYGFRGSTFAPATVETLGHARTPEELDERLAGWESKISDPDGVGWIKSQLSTL